MSEQRVERLRSFVRSGRGSGRTRSAKSASTWASMASVLANWPVARAKSRTCRGLATTTGSPAAASAATPACSKPPVAGVVAAYDFSGFRLIGDIGGGRGHLLHAVLDSAPDASGVLFDLPHVVREAAGVASARLNLQAGDFFKDALPSCDAYLVMEVIHDWGDEDAVAILKAIRRVALPDARLLLIEQIVPDDPGPHWTKTLDIHMLALLGGRQRTRPEYEALFARAGFLLGRQIDTFAGISILERPPPSHALHSASLTSWRDLPPGPGAEQSRTWVTVESEDIGDS